MILIYLVVYHYNPTSNRNHPTYKLLNKEVVYHYNPTSNRNPHTLGDCCGWLYIIIILHQTATLRLPYYK